MAARKPVVRSDGRRYRSVADAARELCGEWGIGTRREVMTTARVIAAVASHRPHHKSAYGYGWEYE